MAPRVIHELIQQWAHLNPDAEAIAAPGRRPVTYGRLHDLIHEVRQTLNGLGIGCGDRVATVLPDGPETATCFLAVTSCAAIAPLNPRYRRDECDFYLSELRASALIVQSDSPAIAVAKARGIPVMQLLPDASAEAGVFSLSAKDASRSISPGPVNSSDVALLLHTSGTTARPKLVPLTQGNLLISAQNIQASLSLSTSDRCLSVMPLFHVHGIVGALLSSIAAGSSIVCTPGFNAAQFMEWMRDFRPTWYTAVPTMHQSILSRLRSHGPTTSCTSLRFIRSCSSALPPQLMAELEDSFGVPVVEAYGMTEASHQIAINPLPPGKRKPGSVGKAVNQDVGIMDKGGVLLPDGQSGEIVLRGHNVTGGYEDNPPANVGAFTHGWFRTGDQGFLDSEGYIFINGRIKEIINRGGEKISPREVDEVLLKHPAIEEAVTFAVPDTKLGQDVAAAVVLRRGETVTELDIQEFAVSRLADFKVPRCVLILTELPKGPSGKVLRVGLAEKLKLVDQTDKSSGKLASFSVSPRTPTEKLLLEIWSKVLEVEIPSIHANFFDLGGNSVLAAQMISRISETKGLDLSPVVLFHRPTVASLAEWLDTRPGSDSRVASILVPIQPNGSKKPFFLTYGLNGSMVAYFHLARCLGPDQPVYGLQPQTENEQLPFIKVHELAARYVREIRALQPEGPYQLGGHSMGGVFAFEAACQLLAEGQTVRLLALFDAVSPGYRRILPSRHTRHEWWRRASYYLGHLARLDFTGKLVYLRHFCRGLTKRALRKIWLLQFRSGLSETRPVPEALPKFLELDRQAIRDYAPRPYQGRLTLFKANRSNLQPYIDGDLGWSRLVAGGLEICEASGDHLTMLQEPQVRSLAEQLKARLAKVVGSQVNMLTKTGS